jgi:hypothetical protein
LKKATLTITMLLFAALLISSIAIEGVVAAKNPAERTFSPSYARVTVDDFGYRISFQLSDGVEILSIRGSFWLQYSYPTDAIREQPIRRHTMYVNLGFYYGKTALGRNIVQTINVDMVAFFPKWIDSGGYPHNLYLDTPMFLFDSVLPDGARVYTGMRLDEDAISRYMAYFGGTLVFSDLSFVLDDGTQIDVGTVEIELIKYSSSLSPQVDLVGEPANVTYVSNTDILTAATEGIGPLIYAVDLVVAAALWVTGGTLLILAYLHRKGRITLSAGRITSRFRTQPVDH